MAQNPGIFAGFFSLALMAGAASAEDFPKGTVSAELNGDVWTIRFDGAGKYEVKRQGEAVAEGKYKATGERVEFSGERGPDDQVGKYKWKLDGKKLTFTLIEDEAEGRKRALTTGTWTLKE
jgi:hypothetical protein